jgi:hypothetical protein
VTESKARVQEILPEFEQPSIADLRAAELAREATVGVITLKGIAIYRVDQGKLMERWVVSDLHGLLEEIQSTATR